jgi:hypothetical protein
VPGQQLVQYDPDAVQVAAVIHSLPSELLGASVFRGAEPRIGAGSGKLLGRDVRAVQGIGGNPSQAEIQDLDPLAGGIGLNHYDVGGFKVPVNDSLTVGSVEHHTQRAEQRADSLRVEPALSLQQLVERKALDVLHGKAWPLRISHRRLIQFHGDGVAQAAHQLDLAAEKLAVVQDRGVLLLQDLDRRQGPVHPTGQVNAAHAAPAQEADGLVPAQEADARHRFDLAALARALGPTRIQV